MGQRGQVPLVKNFYQKARYPLDLGAAKPVKRRIKCNSTNRSNLGIVPDRTDKSDNAKIHKATSDETCESGCPLDGGVAQLVRAAES